MVAEAIELSGRHDIHISDQPRPHPDNEFIVTLKNHFSIYVYSNTAPDCSDFWKVYRELENSTRWKTYFALLD